MPVTFQLESWATFSSDPGLPSLLLEHYNELAQAHDGQMALGLDTGMYQALDSAGVLLILTARDGPALAGYCLALAKRHPHYPTVCGFEDMYYLTPSARKGMTGYNLIRTMVELLLARGCQRQYWETKEFAKVAPLFQRLGLAKMSEVWCLSAWETK